MNKITAVAKVQGSDVYVTFISCSNSEIGVVNGAVHEFGKLGHTVDPNKVSHRRPEQGVVLEPWTSFA